MSGTIKIKKGFDIKLNGAAERVYGSAMPSETFVIKPTDFIGVSPRLMVEAGSEVKAGTPLFHDKKNEDLVFVSPVSGEVVEIKRGAKRKLLEIVILADKELRYEEFGNANAQSLGREEVISKMLKGGVWPLVKQRPFNVIANPTDEPKSIFISAFDSAPLAPDYDFILHGHEADFQAGIDALAKLTSGKVHLNVKENSPTTKVVLNAKGVEINKISGPHPAGNVGIQIHHIDPLNKGENVWVVNPQDVLIIGRLFNSGKYDATRVIAVAGSEVKHPKYYKTLIGCNIKPLIDGNVESGKSLRFISGNVLKGTAIQSDGYMSYYDNMLTVIAEGDEPEFLGWVLPGMGKLSLSKTFPSWLFPSRTYDLNTNLHGEERAFVVTGEYEKVLPMDIYPVLLLKAIMAEDVEAMENLGIYEVDEEDFALCEFVCTSKIDVQQILRKGLDITREECA